MKNVTVLGGLGYIGSHLIEMLAWTGDYIVRCLDKELFGWDHLGDLLSTDVNVLHYTGDVKNASDLSSVIKGSDCVVNLAGIVGDPACSIDDEETWLCNTESTNIIADICNYHGVKKLIYASSCSVYGASPSHILLNEGSYLNPVSLYAKTKIDSEKILLNKFEGCCSILRFATVFGYSKRMRFDLVVNGFVIKALRNKRIEVFGGEQYRPFIHCRDAAKAIMRMIEFDDTDKLCGEVFNLASDNISIKDLGRLVVEIIPETDLELVQQKEDERNYRVDSTKIKWLLDFEPEFNLEIGIKEMVQQLQSRQFDDWETNNKYYNHKMGC